MNNGSEAGQVLRTMWQFIDAQDWEAMAGIMDAGLQARYVHTGEAFDKQALVTLNREYPGRWHATVEDVVTEGERAVSRACVSDGAETYHVASFATVRGGKIVQLVEVWTSGSAQPPRSRRPS